MIRCLLLLAVLLPAASCGKKNGALIVGMELSYPPFEMRNAANEPDGISVRMSEDLGKFLNRPVEIRDVAWDGIIAALKSGKIDLIIASMTRTEERMKSIAFSDPYVTNGLCLLVAKGSDIQKPEDLQVKPRKVAVKLATTGHTWARAHLPENSLIVLDDAAICVLEVIQGRADAFIYDQISIYQFWKKNEDTTRPILRPIREESWAIGLRKEDEELRRQVNAFLGQYRAQGGFDRLAERYMKDEKAAFESLGVPFVFH